MEQADERTTNTLEKLSDRILVLGVSAALGALGVPQHLKEAEEKLRRLIGPPLTETEDALLAWVEALAQELFSSLEALRNSRLQRPTIWQSEPATLMVQARATKAVKLVELLHKSNLNWLDEESGSSWQRLSGFTRRWLLRIRTRRSRKQDLHEPDGVEATRNQFRKAAVLARRRGRRARYSWWILRKVHDWVFGIVLAVLVGIASQFATDAGARFIDYWGAVAFAAIISWLASERCIAPWVERQVAEVWWRATWDGGDALLTMVKLLALEKKLNLFSNSDTWFGRGIVGALRGHPGHSAAKLVHEHSVGRCWAKRGNMDSKQLPRYLQRRYDVPSSNVEAN